MLVSREVWPALLSLSSFFLDLPHWPLLRQSNTIVDIMEGRERVGERSVRDGRVLRQKAMRAEGERGFR